MDLHFRQFFHELRVIFLLGFLHWLYWIAHGRQNLLAIPYTFLATMLFPFCGRDLPHLPPQPYKSLDRPIVRGWHHNLLQNVHRFLLERCLAMGTSYLIV